MLSAPGASGRGSSGADYRSSARAGLWERGARVAADAYERAAYRLSRILPQSSRLNYTYQGPREDLRGTTFAIENKLAKIVISCSSGSGE